MYIIDRKVEVPVNPLQVNTDNVSAFFAVTDMETSKSFCKNYGGYPRSDIAQIIDENNEEVAIQLASRLLNRQTENTSSVSDVDLLASHRSKYLQTPSEMVNWIDSKLAVRDEREAAKLSEDEREAYLKQQSEKRKQLFDSLSSAERDEVNQARRRKEVSELIYD